LESRQQSGTISTTADWLLRVIAKKKHAMDTAAHNRGCKANWPLKLPALGWKDVVWRLWTEFNDDRILLVSAGATFYLLLLAFISLGRWPVLLIATAAEKIRLRGSHQSGQFRRDLRLPTGAKGL
jgi:hypothetical protein